MKIRRVILEALPTLMLVSAITVAAGFLLNSALSLGEVVGILIITPAILSTGGDIGTSFGARITTQLHSGLIEPRFRKFRLIYINFLALFLCGLLVSGVIGVVAYLLRVVIDPSGALTLLDFMILSLGAGSIEYAIILTLSLFVAFISYRRGLDPDNLVAPLVTTIADLIGISAIFMIIYILI